MHEFTQSLEISQRKFYQQAVQVYYFLIYRSVVKLHQICRLTLKATKNENNLVSISAKCKPFEPREEVSCTYVFCSVLSSYDVFEQTKLILFNCVLCQKYRWLIRVNETQNKLITNATIFLLNFHLKRKQFFFVFKTKTYHYSF